MVFERIFCLKIFIVSSDGYQVVFQINLLFDLIHSKWIRLLWHLIPLVQDMGFRAREIDWHKSHVQRKFSWLPFSLVFFSMVCPLKMHRMKFSVLLYGESGFCPALYHFVQSCPARQHSHSHVQTGIIHPVMSSPAHCRMLQRHSHRHLASDVYQMMCYHDVN